MKKTFLILLLFLSSCTNRETGVDLYTLRGWDYRLFQSTKSWELAKSVQDNDFNEMTALIKEGGMEVNATEPRFGQTLLFLTLWHKQYEACERLLDLGANPNVHSRYDDETPLIQAADETDSDASLKFMRLLVAHGANVNEVQYDRSETEDTARAKAIIRTPLIAACGGLAMTDPLTKIKFLVEQGADIHFIGNRDRSVLTEALTQDNLDVALYLLEKGADYKQRFSDGNKYDSTKQTYILDFLRQQLYDINSKDYLRKMAIVAFLAKRGLNYWQQPIHPRLLQDIRERYPTTWKDYIEKY